MPDGNVSYTHGPSQACLHWCFSMSFCMPSMILFLVGRFMCSLVARKCLAVIGTFFLVHPIQKYATDFKVLRLSEWQSKAIMSESSAPHLLKSSLRVVASYSRLDDGGETDLDLGNYERMMYLSLGRCSGAIWQALSMPAIRSFQENTPGISRAQGQTLPFKLLNCRDNNLTTGKIYESVIKKDCSRLKCPYCCLHATIICKSTRSVKESTWAKQCKWSHTSLVRLLSGSTVARQHWWWKSRHKLWHKTQTCRWILVRSTGGYIFYIVFRFFCLPFSCRFWLWKDRIEHIDAWSGHVENSIVNNERNQSASWKGKSNKHSVTFPRFTSHTLMRRMLQESKVKRSMGPDHFDLSSEVWHRNLWILLA